MKNILVAVNSFKETADAVEVAEMFNRHLDKSFFKVIKKPISDGGDSFLEVCRFYFELEIMNYSITTPYDETYMDCKVGLDRKNKTMYIESAEVLGLKKIPQSKRHPLKLSSKGFGDLLQLIIQDTEELKYDIEKIIIGIGGTGTMDLGLGMCSQFGLKLFDSSGYELNVLPENFPEVNDIEFKRPVLPFTFELVLDVNNSLLGKTGGVIFGHQKGASDSELKIFESGWNKIVKLLDNNLLMDASKEISGAGGGLLLGFSLLSNVFRNPASKFINDNLKVSNNISDIDIVITGEGSFDEQSMMGKGAGIIMRLFDDKNIPVALCCGKIDRKVSEQLGMNVFPMELKTYVNDPIKDFERAIKIVCDEISGMTDILTKIS